MSNLTDLSDLVNRLSFGSSGDPQTIFFNKSPYRLNVSAATSSAGVRGTGWKSHWTHMGIPGGGIAPTTAQILTNSTAGCFKQKNPNQGQQQWLLNFSAAINNGAVRYRLILYDRLAHMGGLNASTTSIQNVNLSGITRYSGSESVGNMILYENYLAIGATARILTITYTNQNYVSGRTTTLPIGGTSGQSIGSAYIPNLMSGETGVISVESVQLNGSTGTAGDFGISIIRPISYGGSMGGTNSNNVFAINGIPSVPEVKSGACLATLMFLSTGTIANDTYLRYFGGYIQLINK
jgi:hypothetical protein